MPKWSNCNEPREKYISRKKIWERDKGICQMCLRQCVYDGASPDGFRIDHVVAVYEGGAGQGYSNLRTLCQACHKRVTKTQAAERAAELRATKPIKEKVKKKWPTGKKILSRKFQTRKSQSTK